MGAGIQVDVRTWQGVGPHALVMDEGKGHEQQEANNVGQIKHLQKHHSRCHGFA